VCSQALRAAPPAAALPQEKVPTPAGSRAGGQPASPPTAATAPRSGSGLVSGARPAACSAQPSQRRRPQLPRVSAGASWDTGGGKAPAGFPGGGGMRAWAAGDTRDSGKHPGRGTAGGLGQGGGGKGAPSAAWLLLPTATHRLPGLPRLGPAVAAE